MANEDHIYLLKQGIAAWNVWREENPQIQPDLSGATLHSFNLSKFNLNQANLKNAGLGGAWLVEANLSYADLTSANLNDAVLTRADLSKAKLFQAELWEAQLGDAILVEADLGRTDLRRANFRKANLYRARLEWANLCGTSFEWANLSECSVYGVSSWDTYLEGANQSNLRILYGGSYHSQQITVDYLEIAQFIYLLLNNKKIRDVIDTITSKVVLILGRFIPERKVILEAIREELRNHNYTPVLFDFEKPSSQDFTETIITLAHLSRFIIADLTDPSSIPQELQTIIPQLAIPIQPLLESTKKEYSMFSNFNKYPWVLPIFRYRTQAHLIESLSEYVIEPAQQKAKELAERK